MGGNQKSLIQEESGKSDAIIIAEVAVVLVFVIACLILFVALSSTFLDFQSLFGASDASQWENFVTSVVRGLILFAIFIGVILILLIRTYRKSLKSKL